MGCLKNRYARRASVLVLSTSALKRDLGSLLADEALPRAAIREHPAASWVERDKKDTDETAAEILRQQKRFGRIWGRIAGTRWYLYDEKPKPSLAWTASTARKVLASVPSVAATEA